MVLAMVDRRAPGMFHTAGPTWFNRFEYAGQIAAAFGLDPSLLAPGRTRDLKQPATRPAHSGLVTERVASELGVRPLPVAQGLAAVRAEMGG
jgi:dTDP-4-dehydrorhamnose reductase